MSDLEPLFSPVEANFDWLAMEASIHRFWDERQIFPKLRSQLKEYEHKFSFIDGPITANNPMGVHHARGRTLKDIYQRYMAMLGFNQRFQNGFDTQGLWVEVEVEKTLGLNSKRDIEKMGLETFVNHCKARIKKYSDLISRQSRQLGQQMDWEHSYYTHLDDNIEHIWHFLKICHKRGWLYQSRLVMPWCPRCSTSLSVHEMTDSYTIVKHPSVFLQLPVIGVQNRFFLVWTTTPWTLTANTALAVHPDLTYLLVEQENKEYYLAESAVEVLGHNFNVLTTVEGKELLNLTYYALFAELELQKGVEHKIIQWEEVSADEGTGIVHIAPGCGAEDFNLRKEFNLGLIAPIDEQGKLKEGLEPFSGFTTKEVASLIFESLNAKGYLFRKSTIEHRYPVCWRCKTELVFKLETEWFIFCDEIRPQLQQANKTVNWVPEYAGKRMHDWLENMGDWCISRKRYWGLPLPFYPCDCGEVTVVGSLDELRQLTAHPKTVETLPELHRPWIDSVKINCPKCGEQVSRVSEVGDCWLDAGIVPFSTLKYLTNRNYWQQWFPADLVCEMIEQVRLWFYSQLFMAVTLVGRAPFKSVVVYDEVRHEDGQPMSKSSHMILLDEALQKNSADVLRWNYARQKPDAFLRFGFNVTAEVKRKFIPFWNAVRFFVNFASLDVSNPSQLTHNSNNVFDLWIFTRLRNVCEEYQNSLNQWDVRRPTLLLEEFFEDLTNWYIRSSRRRFWKEKESLDKNAAYSTLFKVLLNVSYLLAPYTPFLAEYIFQLLRHPFANQLPESIHLCSLSETKDLTITNEVLESFDKYKSLVESGRLLRNQAGIKFRQPLSAAYIEGKSPFPRKELKVQFLRALKHELNVKEIRFTNELTSDLLENQENVSHESAETNLKLYLITEINSELKQEGIAREIVRAIQQLRKEADLNWNSRIKVLYETQAQELSESLQNFEDYVKRETLCSSIQSEQTESSRDFIINNVQLKLAIEVISH